MNKWTKRNILDLWKPVPPDLLGVFLAFVLWQANGDLLGSLFFTLLCLAAVRGVLSFFLWLDS